MVPPGLPEQHGRKLAPPSDTRRITKAPGFEEFQQLLTRGFLIPGAVTLDAGVRYTTTIANTPVKFRLQGLNLSNTFSVTPNASGQINAFESRRVEASMAADF